MAPTAFTAPTTLLEADCNAVDAFCCVFSSFEGDLGVAVEGSPASLLFVVAVLAGFGAMALETAVPDVSTAGATLSLIALAAFSYSPLA